MVVADRSTIVGVFKGGGAKGALYAGALQAVGDRRITFSQVAGSSAGAITAAFLAAGATPDDLTRLADDATELGLLVPPPAFRSARNLRDRLGIMSLDGLRAWLAHQLGELYTDRLGGDAVGDAGPTFAQLDAAGGIPLHIAAADLHWRAPVVFNSQLTPELPVADAAAASAAIPLVFETPFFESAEGRPVPVADGGVMANLPMFVFTDPGYRAVAGLAPLRDEDVVVGFTLVDRDTPHHTSAHGPAGDEYRRRFAAAAAPKTFAQLLAAATSEPAAKAKRSRLAAVRAALSDATARVLLGVVRLLGLLLVPVNVVLAWSTSRAGHLSRWVGNRRAQRWVRFVDLVLDLAPAYFLAGLVLLPFVLWFGIPAVAATTWPDWGNLIEGKDLSEIAVALTVIGFAVLVIWIGLLLVVVVAVLGLGAYIAGRTVKPLAEVVGPHLVATFMHNPQEPAWAEVPPNPPLIRIRVPPGWTALRTTDDPEEMRAILAEVRTSVRDQLEAAGLGTAMPLRTGAR